MYILPKFSTSSRSWKSISQFYNFSILSIPRGNPAYLIVRSCTQISRLCCEKISSKQLKKYLKKTRKKYLCCEKISNKQSLLCGTSTYFVKSPQKYLRLKWPETNEREPKYFACCGTYCTCVILWQVFHIFTGNDHVGDQLWTSSVRSVLLPHNAETKWTTLQTFTYDALFLENFWYSFLPYHYVHTTFAKAQQAAILSTAGVPNLPFSDHVP